MSETVFQSRIVRSLGPTVINHLNEVVLRVGQVTFTRQEMIDKLGCANFVAAATLTQVLRRLGIASAAGLMRMDPFSLARSKRVGMVTLYVAMCFLDYSGHNVEKWWHWDREKSVKFSTFKASKFRRAKRRERQGGIGSGV